MHVILIEKSLAVQNVDPYAKESGKQKVALWVGLGILVILLLVGFGMSALGLFNKKPDPVLAQKGPEIAPILPAAAPAQQPALPIEAPPKPVEMPQDIYDWLEHLRRTDEKLASDTNAIGMSAGIDRVSGLADMYGKALDGNFEDHNPRSESDNINKKTDRTFEELANYFDSLPPPTECVPIYNAFKTSLSETESNVHKIQQITDEAFSKAMSGGNTQDVVDSLKSIYSDHRDGIDEYRRETDNLVQRICDKYKTRKWFSIKPDPANPIMKGMVDMMLGSMGQ